MQWWNCEKCGRGCFLADANEGEAYTPTTCPWNTDARWKPSRSAPQQEKKEDAPIAKGTHTHTALEKAHERIAKLEADLEYERKQHEITTNLLNALHDLSSSQVRTKQSKTGTLPPVGENTLADQIREVIGAGPDAEVAFQTPQFERPEGEPQPVSVQVDPAWWVSLREMTVPELRELGCGQWNDPTEPTTEGEYRGGTLMLFPGEWYSKIPEGFEVFTINEEAKHFQVGKIGSGTWFGCLPYGIIVGQKSGTVH